jgi:hypothetical protein
VGKGYPAWDPRLGKFPIFEGAKHRVWDPEGCVILIAGSPIPWAWNRLIWKPDIKHTAPSTPTNFRCRLPYSYFLINILPRIMAKPVRSKITSPAINPSGHLLKMSNSARPNKKFYTPKTEMNLSRHITNGRCLRLMVVILPWLYSTAPQTSVRSLTRTENESWSKRSIGWSTASLETRFLWGMYYFSRPEAASRCSSRLELCQM